MFSNLFYSSRKYFPPARRWGGEEAERDKGVKSDQFGHKFQEGSLWW